MKCFLSAPGLWAGLTDPSPLVEIYVARDGSEACLSLNPPKAFCARDGTVKETKLELAFSRCETHEGKIEVYRPKGLLGNGEGIREDPLGETDEMLFL